MGRKRREPRPCQRCGTLHQLRGPYCGRSCGNVRTYSDQLRQVRSDAHRAYMAANPDVAHQLQDIRKMQLSSNGDIRTFDDWMVIPPLDDDDAFADWDANSY